MEDNLIKMIDRMKKKSDLKKENKALHAQMKALIDDCNTTILQEVDLLSHRINQAIRKE